MLPPQPFWTSGIGDAAPAVTSPALTPISPHPGKLLHGRGSGRRVWSSHRAPSRRDVTRWLQHTQHCCIPGRQCQSQTCSHSQRGHTIHGSTAACQLQRGVGAQPRWVPSKWKDTMNTDKVPGGTASSCPATVSHVQTDRRSRVPHSPASTRQLLLPWEGGDMALGASRKVLYWSIEGKGCTTSRPSAGPSPGPFQPSTSSRSLPGQLGHNLSPALGSGWSLLLGGLGDDAHQQGVIAAPHQQRQALLRPHRLVHVLGAPRRRPVDLQHHVPGFQPCPAGTTRMKRSESEADTQHHCLPSAAGAVAPGVLQLHLAGKTPSLGKSSQVVFAAEPKPCCSGHAHTALRHKAALTGVPGSR